MTISPDDGYGLKSIKVEDASYNSVTVDISGNTATFTMPASNVSVVPSWIRIYSVTVANVDGGEVTSDKANATFDEVVTLTIAPADDYCLESIEVRDFVTGQINATVEISGTTGTFMMPGADVSVTPTWNRCYGVNIASVIGGEVTMDKAKAMVGETVILTITPADGYELGSLEVKDESNNSVAVKFALDGISLVAVFTMPSSNVTVTPTWSKLYSVTIANVTGGVILGKAKAIAGESIRLTISPADGYRLERLEVKDASNNSVAVTVTGTTATFTMPSSDATVTPSWNKLYDVTIAKVTGGNVTSDIANSIAGETVTLTITPDDGFGLGSLEVKDASNNSVAIEISGNKATFTMPSSNVTVTPTWGKLYNVTIVNADYHWGSVSRDKAKAVSGETVTLTITPYYGYLLGSLEVKDESNNSVAVEISDNTATFTMPASDVSVTPTWSELYNVTVPNGNPREGEVTSDKAQAVAGETVTLTITPTDGYMLESLKVVDDSDNSIAVEISGNKATFTMPNSRVHVYSTWLTYKINIYGETGGKVTSDKRNALAGETITLTIIPADGFVFGGLEVEDASKNAVAFEISGNIATFTMPASDVAVTPTWNAYKVNIKEKTGGELTSDKRNTQAGETVTLTITPADGYVFGGGGSEGRLG